MSSRSASARLEVASGSSWAILDRSWMMVFSRACNSFHNCSLVAKDSREEQVDPLLSPLLLGWWWRRCCCCCCWCRWVVVTADCRLLCEYKTVGEVREKKLFIIFISLDFGNEQRWFISTVLLFRVLFLNFIVMIQSSVSIKNKISIKSFHKRGFFFDPLAY